MARTDHGPGEAEPNLAHRWGEQRGQGRIAEGKEVAAELKVSTATVYKLVDSEALSHTRVLNAIRVRRRDLRRYLAQRRTR
jgi:excisionase family DNA binding protein